MTINADATNITAKVRSKESATRIKKSRREKNSWNTNRVNFRSGEARNPAQNPAKKTKVISATPSEADNKAKGLKDEIFLLDSIFPSLVSLPSKTLHHQAKDLASLVLSKAIAVKHATESLSNMTSSTSVPSSARINFKIQGTKSTPSLK